MLIAAAIQFVCCMLSAMLLDGGNALALCLSTFVAFWVGVTLLVLRHPRNPSDIDLWCIRYGFLPLFLVSFVIGDILVYCYEHHQPS